MKDGKLGRAPVFLSSSPADFSLASFVFLDFWYFSSEDLWEFFDDLEWDLDFDFETERERERE